MRQKEFFLSLLQTPILHFQPLPRSLFCDYPFYFHFSISCCVKHSVANIPIEIRRKLIPCGEGEHFLFEHVLFLFMPSHFEKRKEKDVEEGEKSLLPIEITLLSKRNIFKNCPSSDPPFPKPITFCPFFIASIRIGDEKFFKPLTLSGLYGKLGEVCFFKKNEKSK